MASTMSIKNKNGFKINDIKLTHSPVIHFAHVQQHIGCVWEQFNHNTIIPGKKIQISLEWQRFHSNLDLMISS